MDTQAVDWTSISKALRAPMPADAIEWRFAKAGKVNPGQAGEVLAYVTARGVMDRLDDVVGAGDWSYDWQAITTGAKGLEVVKGTITVHGVSKSDVGDASNFEPNKGAVSDSLKRAAVQWGIGRNLYDLPEVRVKAGQYGEIPEAELAKLQKAYARRFGLEASSAPTPAAAPVASSSEDSAGEVPVTFTPEDHGAEASSEARTFGNLGVFLTACVQEKGYANAGAVMQALGVKTLSGVNLAAAFANLPHSPKAA